MICNLWNSSLLLARYYLRPVSWLTLVCIPVDLSLHCVSCIQCSASFCDIRCGLGLGLCHRFLHTHLLGTCIYARPCWWTGTQRAAVPAIGTSPAWDAVRIDQARGWVRLSKFSPSSATYLHLVESRFPHVYEMGTIIEPSSVGIAKINSRDNSYETLAQSLVCSELK